MKLNDILNNLDMDINEYVVADASGRETELTVYTDGKWCDRYEEVAFTENELNQMIVKAIRDNHGRLTVVLK